MTSKAQSLRNKRAQAATKPVEAGYVPSPRGHTSTPTNERLARGKWARPNKDHGAYVDQCSDMIGRLLVTGQINQSQEQSARAFSEVYGAYKIEIGIPECKSCIAVSSGGYDAGDGNPAVYAAYYKMREKIGRVKTSMLQNECFKDAEAMPYDLAALRNALNCLGSE
jgi:hypothetical protein